jgi:GH15 family glucan-1,4-alpha-glucosidase
MKDLAVAKPEASTPGNLVSSGLRQFRNGAAAQAFSIKAAMVSAIENYALIGDCKTAGLVGLDGSIDWLCWPRFDSAACFAALVGTRENGRWLLGAAKAGARLSRRYRDNTLILETTIEQDGGAATVVDFMPLRERTSSLVRLVYGVRGQLSLKTELALRFDYGSLMPWVTRLDDGAWCAISGPDMAVLRASLPLSGDHLSIGGHFTISPGQKHAFILSHGASHELPPEPIDGFAALTETEEFWRDWTSRARTTPRWSEAMLRSLITLKALTHSPTGGIVASVTTSLPERLGGSRNWDYRFCWLRDATFTLIALMNAGFHEEACAWRVWLLRTTAGEPERMQIMYGVTGKRRVPEWEVSWLDGYQGAKPVRVGNLAATQMQIDVYGEMMDALHHGRHGNLAGNQQGWEFQLEMLRHLECIWQDPDHGIWEVRGDRQHFVNSKVMAWVAFDRGIKTIEYFKLQGPLDRWRKLRQAIHDDVCRYGFNPDIGAFVQSYGSKHLDASALLIPLVGFLSPQDRRVRSTVEAIQRHLVVEDLVRRYNSEAGVDGLPPGEGVFLPCSFWLADNLILLGRQAEAEKLFERVLALRNDVGLLSEEYDVGSGRLVGNFPQAFSHIALINTGHALGHLSRHRRYETGGVQADAANAEPKTESKASPL